MSVHVLRHEVAVPTLPALFRADCEELEPHTETARRAGRASAYLAYLCQWIWHRGAVLAPDSLEVARALRVGAQAKAALFLTACLDGTPRLVQLGDGPPVSYAEPSDPADVSPEAWTLAFQQAVVSRQAGVLDALCAVPGKQLMGTAVHRSQVSFDLAEMHRDLWTHPTSFAQRLAFAASEAEFLGAKSRGETNHATNSLLVPYFAVLRALGRLDAAAFGAALAEALRLHKKFWGATEKRRKDLAGVVSLPLTAAAALAYDRGLRFDVGSDYAPRSWVTGDVFRHLEANP